MNKNKKDEWEGFDDCPICQAMKNGEANSTEGLTKAFKKAEEQGIGIVGFGDIHDENSSILSPYQKK